MKEFEMPEMEIICFEVEDVLTASGDANLPDDDF